MEKEATDTSPVATSRVAHACQSCREKRVRCSGDRPVCHRCLQHGVKACVYGFARGDRRKSVLSALEEHNSRKNHESSWPEPLNIVTASSMKASASTENSPVTKTKTEPADEEGDYDSVDSSVPSSSLLSPSRSRHTDSTPEAKASSTKSSRKQQRRSRITSACSECKKRRRKCTGDMPCQTCKAFSAECVYDRSQDRRSKAYFQRKLNDGVREAMESDDVDGVVKMLQQNNHYDDVAMDLKTAIENKQQVADQRLQSETVTDAVQIICQHYCGLGSSNAAHFHSQWLPREIRDRQEAMLRGPQHLILPYIIEDNSPLSKAVANFRDAVKHMLQQGKPLDEILGPLDTKVDLLFRPRNESDIFTTCTWACEIARIYSHIDIFTRLGISLLLSRYMRWLIDPTEENYILVPNVIKPTRLQLIIPHYASADLYPIAEVRNSLIKGQLSLEHSTQAPDGLGIRFDWQFDMAKATTRDPNTGVIRLTRLFVESSSNEKYWTYSKNFLENLPESRSHLNIIKHTHGWDEL